MSVLEMIDKKLQANYLLFSSTVPVAINLLLLTITPTTCRSLFINSRVPVWIEKYKTIPTFKLIKPEATGIDKRLCRKMRCNVYEAMAHLALLDNRKAIRLLLGSLNSSHIFCLFFILMEPSRR